MKNFIEKAYDIVVVGGGISGVCAAISSAREGAKTALIHDRPVLGGNASSEARICIVGADCHGSRPDARETGIIEEYLLENRKRNSGMSYSISDAIFWEMVKYQEGLELYLNTRATAVNMENNVIESVEAIQLTTEKNFKIEGRIFIDCTGDGFIASLSGAEYMMGREGKDEFGEPDAPDEHDMYTMGNTLLFKAVDVGAPVSFIKPFWANTYTEDDLKYRGHRDGSHIWRSQYSVDAGYWWIEMGGGELNVIKDGEYIRDELLKVLYGVWDHIKNGGDHGAENYDLDWVQFLPGKRESRRIIGDYILREQDLLEGKIFEDGVAYGGWPMDMHVPKGIHNLKEMPTRYIHIENMYSIPYRCYYSRNIENLMMAGRNISCTHMALGSTRVMGTCAVGGQAVGVAAALAVRENVNPRDASKFIHEIQQILLREDCYIPGISNKDKNDIALESEVEASSFIDDNYPENVINGVHRNVHGKSNCWVSREIGPNGEWICLKFTKKVVLSRVQVHFDSNLSKEISLMMFKGHLKDQIPGVPPQLVKDYIIDFINEGQLAKRVIVKDNYQRFNLHILDECVACSAVKITINATNGDPHARIFEIRAYEDI